jgi:hypothetical protein
MIASVVTHGPRSKVAPMALQEMDKACELFGHAAQVGGRAAKFSVSIYIAQDGFFDWTLNGT